MTTNYFNELSAADRAFAERAQQHLRASEQLDYVEAARLSATRARVREMVSTPRSGAPAWGWIAAPALMAAVTFSVLRFNPAAPIDTAVAPSADALMALSADVNASTPAALEWEFDEAGPDFYSDLAFYQWLQSRSSSEPNA